MIKTKNIITLILLILPCFSAIAQTDSGNTFTDERDNKTYRTVKIGKLIWMAENLNYAILDTTCYVPMDKEVVCYESVCYDFDESNCQKYGRLYSWDAAMKACPAGWRVPNDDDWDDLVSVAGGYEEAAVRLKSKTGWDEKGIWRDDEFGKGTDEFGFSAMPGGYASTNHFGSAGYRGNWWSASEFPEVSIIEDNYENKAVGRWYMYGGFLGRSRPFKNVPKFSLRCVKDVRP